MVSTLREEMMAAGEELVIAEVRRMRLHASACNGIALTLAELPFCSSCEDVQAVNVGHFE